MIGPHSTFLGRAHKSGTTGCWPTPAGATTSRRSDSCSHRWPATRAPIAMARWRTLSRPGCRPRSCAGTVASRCQSCGCSSPPRPSARHLRGSPHDQREHSSTPAVRGWRGGIAPTCAQGPSSASSSPESPSQRGSLSALPAIGLTADAAFAGSETGCVPAIAIAIARSPTTVACAAVSSLEACPTPALRPVQLDRSLRTRAGIRQP